MIEPVTIRSDSGQWAITYKDNRLTQWHDTVELAWSQFWSMYV